MNSAGPASSASVTSIDASATAHAAKAFGARNGVAYGLMGFALAFAALPLYVVLPHYYAKEFGVPLATLGAVLLGARLFDAFIDPALGRLTDKLFARSASAVLAFGLAAALLLGVGFALLFFPQVTSQTHGPKALVVWASVMLVLTYAGYSALSVAHQAWAALLGGTESERSRIVAWREGLGLAGVVTASVLPSVAGMPVTSAVFALALGVGWLGWQRAVRPASVRKESHAVVSQAGLPISLAQPTPQVAKPGFFNSEVWAPFQAAGFKRLLTVFMLNGIASAVPATLVLFFIQDKLRAPASLEPLFLGSYFLCAALSIPLWLALVKRWGLARSWLAGMLLAMAVFIWASQVGSGHVLAFALICALSGVALGADLALPPALLAGVIQQRAAQSLKASAPSAGSYFGWWSFATKLNLALAAGLALPLLGFFGYAPGARDEAALTALVIAYCVLPCLLKAAAAFSLYALLIRPAQNLHAAEALNTPTATRL